MDLDTFIQLVVVGMASGMGATLGSYIVNEHFVKRLEKLKNSTKG